MKVYLVRHGETPLNAARILQHPDTPLGERGFAQAKRVGQRLARAGIARVLTSDHARARATAEAVRAATGVPVDVEPLLGERDFGIHRGRSWDALDIDLFAPDCHPPGGESVPAFEARVDDAWAAVQAAAADAGGGGLAVVSHGLVCRAIVRSRVTVPPDIDVASARWVNACVTEIEASSGPGSDAGSGPVWRVVRLACAAHLQGLDSLAPASMGPA